MSDTLNSLIKTLEKIPDNGIEYINKVDLFYNSAWNKLVLVGSVAFGVIGILVPFVIQWYQKKTLSISEDLLKKDIENQMLKVKSELLNDINKKLEERIEVFEDKIEKLNSSTNAKAFHLQGNDQLSKGYYSGALSDFITSAQDYLFCDDFSNLQTVLNAILNKCLPTLSKEEINDLKISQNCDLTSFLDELSAKDDKGTFIKIIGETRLILSKLPEKIIDKPKGQTQ